MPTWTDPAQSKSQKVKRLFAWWCAHGGAAGVPDRSALDPAELKDLLPNLILADLEPEPFRVRYRLAGTAITQFTGVDIAGWYLDELLSTDFDEPWLEHYRMAFETRRPVLGSTRVPLTTGQIVTYEFGIFPLRKGGEDVQQFVALEDYFDILGTLEEVTPWKPKVKRVSQ